MEIIKQLVPSKEATSTALGFFDGVHRGHRAVITEAVEYARSHGLVPAVFTLMQSPRTVLLGEEPRAIVTTEEKLSLIEALGVERVYLIDFTTIRTITAERFVSDILIGCFNAKHTGCGDTPQPGFFLRRNKSPANAGRKIYFLSMQLCT